VGLFFVVPRLFNGRRVLSVLGLLVRRLFMLLFGLFFRRLATAPVARTLDGG
jgi:hypothetical protein